MAMKALIAVFVMLVSSTLIACAGDPFAIPDHYATYRLQAKGVSVTVPHPSSWGDPHVDVLSDGTLLTWGGPTEPKYRTSPVLEVALQVLSSTRNAQCSAYLDQSIRQAAGDKATAPIQSVSISGNQGAMVAFRYTVGFASEFGEKVPRPETRHIACIPTPVQNIDLTIDLQAAENQANLADAVFEKVVSEASLSVAAKPE